MKRLVIFGIFILFLINGVCATTWYYYDNEDGTVGSLLPDVDVDGVGNWSKVYRFEYDPPGVYREDSIVGKYAELTTWVPQYPNQSYCSSECSSTWSDKRCPQCAYLVEIQNRQGIYGTRWGETYPLNLIEGNTYYIAGTFKFERINNQNIWQDSTAEMADQQSSMDKMFEFQGANFRWIVTSGWADMNAGYCRRPGNPCLNKFSFTVAAGKNSGMQCMAGYDHLSQNVAPYNDNNPFMAEYERWYNVILAITAYNNASGRTRLWVNGIPLVDRIGYNTMCSTTGSTVTRVYYSGTIAQPAYDAPSHKRSFDNLIFTDNWTEITNKGYMQDPVNQPPQSHEADTNSNGCVDQTELTTYIPRWYAGTATMQNLMSAIALWIDNVGC